MAAMDSGVGAVANLLNDKYFQELAAEPWEGEWETWGGHLDLRKSEIGQIKKAHPRILDRVFNMLQKWRESLQEPIKLRDVDTLAESLKIMKRNDLAVKLEERKGKVSHTETNLGPTGVTITGEKNTVIVGQVKDTTFNIS